MRLFEFKSQPLPQKAKMVTITSILDTLKSYHNAMEEFADEKDLLIDLFLSPCDENLCLLPTARDPEAWIVEQINWVVFLFSFERDARANLASQLGDPNLESDDIEWLQDSLESPFVAYQIHCLLNDIDKIDGDKKYLLPLKRMLTPPTRITSQILAQLSDFTKSELDSYSKKTTEIRKIFEKVNGLMANKVYKPAEHLLKGKVYLKDFDERLIKYLIEIGFDPEQPLENLQALKDGSQKTPLMAAIELSKPLLVLAILMNTPKENLFIAAKFKQSSDADRDEKMKVADPTPECALDYAVKNKFFSCKMVSLFLHVYPELYPNFLLLASHHHNQGLAGYLASVEERFIEYLPKMSEDEEMAMESCTLFPFSSP